MSQKTRTPVIFSNNSKKTGTILFTLDPAETHAGLSHLIWHNFVTIGALEVTEQKIQSSVDRNMY